MPGWGEEGGPFEVVVFQRILDQQCRPHLAEADTSPEVEHAGFDEEVGIGDEAGEVGVNALGEGSEAEVEARLEGAEGAGVEGGEEEMAGAEGEGLVEGAVDGVEEGVAEAEGEALVVKDGVEGGFEISRFNASGFAQTVFTT